MQTCAVRIPNHPVDVILDTDAFNEIDDQFAICYLLACREKLNTKAFYAAPFSNPGQPDVRLGMEQSYEEIKRLLAMVGKTCPVYRGSASYLADEHTPVESEAARDLAKRALNYSPEDPLYVIAIGAITNVASAILMEPKVAENTVIIWLGGHALHFHDTAEFNMRQDVAAARVVMERAVSFVQLPCNGVVSGFTLSEPELDRWLVGKSALCDYLSEATKRYVEKRYPGMPWSKPIWDVTAVAWLMNEDQRFMYSRSEKRCLPGYDNYYEAAGKKDMEYVYHIRRNELMDHMILKICNL